MRYGNRQQMTVKWVRALAVVACAVYFAASIFAVSQPPCKTCCPGGGCTGCSNANECKGCCTGSPVPKQGCDSCCDNCGSKKEECKLSC